MSQNSEELLSANTPFQATTEPITWRTEPITWRTPGRKLTKEDLSATSALILGCTCQCCPDMSECSSSGPLTD